jgi:hypothetical protein
LRCTYHVVARSELCLLHKPHQINIPSRSRFSNGLLLAILPNGKHVPATSPTQSNDQRLRSTGLPGRRAEVLRDPGSWQAPCTCLAWADSSAELGLSRGEAAKTEDDSLRVPAPASRAISSSAHRSPLQDSPETGRAWTTTASRGRQTPKSYFGHNSSLFNTKAHR